MRLHLACIALLGWLAGPYSVRAQSFGVTVLGHPLITVMTPSDYSNGVTVDHPTLQLTVPDRATYTLSVQATGDLVGGTFSIPVSTLSLQVLTDLPGGELHPVIALNTVSQTLLSGIGEETCSGALTLRYHLSGGTHLLLPAGRYDTTLLFTITAL